MVATRMVATSIRGRRARRAFSALSLCAAVAFGITWSASLHAAIISYSVAAPTPGVNDISNFTGAANDGANVHNIGGGPYADGADNDAYTYVAFDRGAQGQTFTTGALAGGYKITGIWLRHAGYTQNTDQTYYYVPPNSHFQIRITNPTQSGAAGFVLGTEIATTTGAEPNTISTTFVNTPNGTGTWVHFTFSSPLSLNPSTSYGFDVSAPNSFGGFDVQPFFETLGTENNVYTGGAAYNSGADGSGGDNTLGALAGDRVFVVQLAPVPEPASIALLLLGTTSLLTRRRRKTWPTS